MPAAPCCDVSQPRTEQGGEKKEGKGSGKCDMRNATCDMRNAKSDAGERRLTGSRAAGLRAAGLKDQRVGRVSYRGAVWDGRHCKLGTAAGRAPHADPTCAGLTRRGTTKTKQGERRFRAFSRLVHGLCTAGSWLVGVARHTPCARLRTRGHHAGITARDGGRGRGGGVGGGRGTAAGAVAPREGRRAGDAVGVTPWGGGDA